MFNGLEHFAIASPNPKRLADWYAAHLEFEIVFEYAGNYFVEAMNGGLIEIIPSEGTAAPPPQLRTPGIRHIAIAVSDFDAAYGALKQQNVTFITEPAENQGNRVVFFEDPDRNILHLIYRARPLR